MCKLNHLRRFACLLATTGALTLSGASCSLTPDARTALTDLASTSAASAVEIFFQSVFDRLNSNGDRVDLTVPISEQVH